MNDPEAVKDLIQFKPEPITDPALGGGKERSVTYETRLCMSAQAIDDFLNRDKYAYSYIYWNPQAIGVFVTICKPNPKAHKQKYAPRTERNMQALTENQAQNLINNFPETDLDALVTRLYEQGYKLIKEVDTVKPWPKKKNS